MTEKDNKSFEKRKRRKEKLNKLLSAFVLATMLISTLPIQSFAGWTTVQHNSGVIKVDDLDTSKYHNIKEVKIKGKGEFEGEYILDRSVIKKYKNEKEFKEKIFNYILGITDLPADWKDHFESVEIKTEENICTPKKLGTKYYANFAGNVVRDSNYSQRWQRYGSRYYIYDNTSSGTEGAANGCDYYDTRTKNYHELRLPNIDINSSKIQGKINGPSLVYEGGKNKIYNPVNVTLVKDFGGTLSSREIINASDIVNISQIEFGREIMNNTEIVIDTIPHLASLRKYDKDLILKDINHIQGRFLNISFYRRIEILNSKVYLDNEILLNGNGGTKFYINNSNIYSSNTNRLLANDIQNFEFNNSSIQPKVAISAINIDLKSKGTDLINGFASDIGSTFKSIDFDFRGGKIYGGNTVNRDYFGEKNKIISGLDNFNLSINNSEEIKDDPIVYSPSRDHKMTINNVTEQDNMIFDTSIIEEAPVIDLKGKNITLKANKFKKMFEVNFSNEPNFLDYNVKTIEQINIWPQEGGTTNETVTKLYNVGYKNKNIKYTGYGNFNAMQISKDGYSVKHLCVPNNELSVDSLNRTTYRGMTSDQLGVHFINNPDVCPKELLESTAVDKFTINGKTYEVINNFKVEDMSHNNLSGISDDYDTFTRSFEGSADQSRNVILIADDNPTGDVEIPATVYYKDQPYNVRAFLSTIYSANLDNETIKSFKLPNGAVAVNTNKNDKSSNNIYFGSIYKDGKSIDSFKLNINNKEPYPVFSNIITPHIGYIKFRTLSGKVEKPEDFQPNKPKLVLIRTNKAMYIMYVKNKTNITEDKLVKLNKFLTRVNASYHAIISIDFIEINENTEKLIQDLESNNNFGENINLDRLIEKPIYLSNALGEDNGNAIKDNLVFMLKFNNTSYNEGLTYDSFTSDDLNTYILNNKYYVDNSNIVHKDGRNVLYRLYKDPRSGIKNVYTTQQNPYSRFEICIDSDDLTCANVEKEFSDDRQFGPWTYVFKYDTIKYSDGSTKRVISQIFIKKYDPSKSQDGDNPIIPTAQEFYQDSLNNYSENLELNIIDGMGHDIITVLKDTFTSSTQTINIAKNNRDFLYFTGMSEEDVLKIKVPVAQMLIDRNENFDSIKYGENGRFIDYAFPEIKIPDREFDGSEFALINFGRPDSLTTGDQIYLSDELFIFDKKEQLKEINEYFRRNRLPNYMIIAKLRDKNNLQRLTSQSEINRLKNMGISTIYKNPIVNSIDYSLINVFQTYTKEIEYNINGSKYQMTKNYYIDFHPNNSYSFKELHDNFSMRTGGISRSLALYRMNNIWNTPIISDTNVLKYVKHFDLTKYAERVPNTDDRPTQCYPFLAAPGEDLCIPETESEPKIATDKLGNKWKFVVHFQVDGFGNKIIDEIKFLELDHVSGNELDIPSNKEILNIMKGVDPSYKSVHEDIAINMADDMLKDHESKNLILKHGNDTETPIYLGNNGKFIQKLDVAPNKYRYNWCTSGDILSKYKNNYKNVQFKIPDNAFKNGEKYLFTLVTYDTLNYMVIESKEKFIYAQDIFNKFKTNRISYFNLTKLNTDNIKESVDNNLNKFIKGSKLKIIYHNGEKNIEPSIYNYTGFNIDIDRNKCNVKQFTYNGKKYNFETIKSNDSKHPLYNLFGQTFNTTRDYLKMTSDLLKDLEDQEFGENYNKFFDMNKLGWGETVPNEPVCISFLDPENKLNLCKGKGFNAHSNDNTINNKDRTCDEDINQDKCFGYCKDKLNTNQNCKNLCKKYPNHNACKSGLDGDLDNPIVNPDSEICKRAPRSYDCNKALFCQDNPSDERCGKTCLQDPNQPKCRAKSCDVNPDQIHCIKTCEQDPNQPKCKESRLTLLFNFRSPEDLTGDLQGAKVIRAILLRNGKHDKNASNGGVVQQDVKPGMNTVKFITLGKKETYKKEFSILLYKINPNTGQAEGDPIEIKPPSDIPETGIPSDNKKTIVEGGQVTVFISKDDNIRDIPDNQLGKIELKVIKAYDGKQLKTVDAKVGSNKIDLPGITDGTVVRVEVSLTNKKIKPIYKPKQGAIINIVLKGVTGDKDDNNNTGENNDDDNNNNGQFNPTPEQCYENPNLPGCGNMLPLEQFCKRYPKNPACMALPPTTKICKDNPQLPQCNNFNPCKLNPDMIGCKPVIPSKEYCDQHPNAKECLPSQELCKTYPDDHRCSTKVPIHEFCKQNPGLSICKDIPSEDFCRKNPNDKKCFVLIPMHQYCKEHPTDPRCKNMPPNVPENRDAFEDNSKYPKIVDPKICNKDPKPDKCNDPTWCIDHPNDSDCIINPNFRPEEGQSTPGQFGPKDNQLENNYPGQHDQGQIRAGQDGTIRLDFQGTPNNGGYLIRIYDPITGKYLYITHDGRGPLVIPGLVPGRDYIIDIFSRDPKDGKINLQGLGLGKGNIILGNTNTPGNTNNTDNTSGSNKHPQSNGPSSTDTGSSNSSTTDKNKKPDDTNKKPNSPSNSGSTINNGSDLNNKPGDTNNGGGNTGSGGSTGGGGNIGGGGGNINDGGSTPGSSGGTSGGGSIGNGGDTTSNITGNNKPPSLKEKLLDNWNTFANDNKTPGKSTVTKSKKAPVGLGLKPDLDYGTKTGLMNALIDNAKKSYRTKNALDPNAFNKQLGVATNYHDEADSSNKGGDINNDFYNNANSKFESTGIPVLDSVKKSLFGLTSGVRNVVKDITEIVPFPILIIIIILLIGLITYMFKKINDKTIKDAERDLELADLQI